jgi:hypothetical protein
MCHYHLPEAIAALCRVEDVTTPPTEEFAPDPTDEVRAEGTRRALAYERVSH